MSDFALTAQPVTARSLSGWLTRHWFAAFLIVYGLWVWLPWLAPALMHAGWSSAGRALYFIYSIFCHQLPERSFFLFGSNSMYSLPQIQAAWKDTFDPMILRQFVGTQTLGWKVAWSDRMVSFYTSIWVFAVLWAMFRRKIKPLPWWGFMLFLLPIVLDGGSHAVSDFASLGQGFRDTNQWLVQLSGNAWPLAYAGDALGSFNSWMRLLTGVLAGLGCAWFALPYVEDSFA
jgi:uncharacterized membrane protein